MPHREPPPGKPKRLVSSPPAKPDPARAGKLDARLRAQSRKVLGKHYANKHPAGGR